MPGGSNGSGPFAFLDFFVVPVASSVVVDDSVPSGAGVDVDGSFTMYRKGIVTDSFLPNLISGWSTNGILSSGTIVVIPKYTARWIERKRERVRVNGYYLARSN